MARSKAWNVVWLLAITSMVADISGEMLMAVLPFLLVAQGASGLALGLVGGATDGLGHVVKLAGGWLGRKRGHRRKIVIAGYLTASLSRLGIAFATLWPATLAFRALDRVGKGLRTAPRDALLAEVVPDRQRGRAFAIHRALDTLGAVIGVVSALILVSFLAFTEQRVVLVAAFIGLASVIPLLFVKEPEASDDLDEADRHGRSPKFALLLVVAGIASLGHLTYLFPVLQAAGEEGVTAGVLWYLLFNLVYMALSFPAGTWMDRHGAPAILAAGLGVLAASMAVFATGHGVGTFAAGFILMGLGYAMTEGNLRAFAARLAGGRDRSFLLGLYHTVAGLATVAGGITAGLLWDRVGHGATFAFAAVASGMAAVGMGFLAERPAKPPTPLPLEAEGPSPS